jgi:hypothetical protein
MCFNILPGSVSSGCSAVSSASQAFFTEVNTFGLFTAMLFLDPVSSVVRGGNNQRSLNMARVCQAIVMRVCPSSLIGLTRD